MAFAAPTGGQIHSVETVVTRRDGTVEDLGVIARRFDHANPVKRWWGRLLLKAGLI